MLQAANRMMFNQAEDEFLDGDEVVGMGVLGKEGSGRLRMQASHASLCILQDASSCLHTSNYSAAFHVRSMRSAHSKGQFFMLFPHDLRSKCCLPVLYRMCKSTKQICHFKC